jgi:glycosyltransferase involved in cell wall biosynthesis
VVGRGADRQRLENIAVEVGVQRFVRFLGFVDDLRSCYNASNVFVMPSTQEGFGIVFLEARACGVPVVAGGLDGSATALSWGLSGFMCDPYSADSIELAILNALASHEVGDSRRDPDRLADEVRREFGHAAYDDRMRDFVARRIEAHEVGRAAG